MAKKSNSAPQNRTLARIARTEAYAEQVRAMFAATVNHILELNKTLPNIEEGEMFSFDAQTEKMRVEVERALRQLHSVATTAIQQGITLEWETANAECDKLVQSVFGKRTVENPEFGAWLKRNGAARRAFIARSDAGMNLSDRVWQSTRQLRDEMEIAITCAVGDGTSAARLSRNVRKYLNDPDLMFRRFRYKDPETGEWRRKWKKRVIDPATGKVTFIDYDKDTYCDQWTGRGYYKSAAMNAMRVARTETNIAYRRADNARWQQMDFVIGQRVQMSRSHPRKDICDKLAGDYPKDFVFDGWHPQCFCFVTPINLDLDEVAEIMSHDGWESELQRVADSKRITDYPDNFKNWVSENAENIKAARARGTEPYFVRNNAGIIDNILNPDATTVIVPVQPQQLPENATDLIEHLRKHGDFNEHYDDELNERDIYRKWDSLSESERLQVLERGRYTGMLSTEDDLGFANLYQSMSKDRMINTLQDELENVRAGYDMENSNHYIIKFKGDDKIVYSHDLEKPLTAAQIKKIEYISANGGMSNYGYWAANDDAKSKLMRELGFIEYREGVIVESWNGKDFTGNPLSPYYGNAMKLSRAAKKRAFELYVDSLPPTLSKEQTAQVHSLARELGIDIKEVKPMTFNDADNGRANIVKDDSNCQSCIVAHEARLRGLDVTAVKYNPDKTSCTYRLGERFQDAFINPKTGKIPNPTKIHGDTPELMIEKLTSGMNTPGRYIVGYNGKTYGHVFVAEKFPNGEIIFYDPQMNDFINIGEYMDVEYFELLKIDKLLFNNSFFTNIVSRI